MANGSQVFRIGVAAILLGIVLAPRSNAQTAVDTYGDPLPPGALRRIGTMRLRHSLPVSSLSYTPDGRRIVSSAYNAVAVWEADTGRRLSMVGYRWIRSCPAVSPDGTLVAHDLDNTALAVREAETGKLRLRIPTRDGSVYGLCFSNDNSRLVFVDNNSTAFLWDIFKGKLIREWQPMKDDGGRPELEFSSDGKQIIYAAETGWIILWDTESGKELHFIAPRKEKHGQYGLAVAPDGEMLATRIGGRIEVWNAKTGRFAKEIELNGTNGLAFSPDNKNLVWVDRDGIGFWDRKTMSIARRIPATIGYPCRLAFSPDGKTLATGCGDYLVRVWDLTSGKEKFPAAEGQGSSGATCFLQDGNTFLRYSSGKLTFQNLKGKAIREHSHGPHGVETMDISPDGKMIAHAEALKGKVRVYDEKTRTDFVPPMQFPRQIMRVSFTPDGRYLPIECAGSDSPNSLHLWKRTGETLTKGREFEVSMRSHIAPESQWIGLLRNKDWDFYEIDTGRHLRHISDWFAELNAASLSGRMLVFSEPWDIPPSVLEFATGKVICRLRCEPKRMDGCRFTFSPDGKFVAAGVGDGGILIWESCRGTQVAKLDGHHGTVHSLQFSPDGRYLVSSGYDTTTLIWDCEKILPAPPMRADLTPEILESLWRNLADGDTAFAYQAMATLSSAPTQAVLLLRSKMKPAVLEDFKAIQDWINDLDNENFKVRTRAALELAKFGEPAVAAFENTLTQKVSLERKRRVRELLENVVHTPAPPTWLRTLRALEVLERVGSADARALLDDLGRGTADSSQTREAQLAVERLKKRDRRTVID